MRSQARVLLLVLGVLPLSGCGGDGSMTGPTPNPSGTPASCAAGTPVSGIPPLSGRLVVSGLRDPLVFKKLIYEMRFDEASAWYAEFGPFYVGLQFSPSELPRYLDGQVPELKV